MALNNVETQLQKAIEMKGTVQEFAAVLRQRMSDLYNTLQNSVRAGFPSDIADTYTANYYAPDNEIIEELSRKMLTEHVELLDNVIADLDRAKNRK